MHDAVLETNYPAPLRRGKVRDVYDLGERLMVVATDRISAYDVVMRQPIPGKGRVLTQLSAFWLATLPACRPHHLEYIVGEHVPAGFAAWRDELADRAMVVRKAAVLPVECVVRGYLIGGGWREYQARGAVSGIALPSGLRLAERLEEPLFTPSTKAETGHDEPISFERACELAQAFAEGVAGGAPATCCGCEGGAAGKMLMESVRRASLEIYRQAAEYARARGIIIADTKFEFGVADGELLLVDEVLTPDSSRFWPADAWRPGENPPSFDKQFLRDYLETTAWDKSPPPPELPAEIIEQTGARYKEAYRRLLAE